MKTTTKFFTLKAAALTITVATTLLNAQTHELTGKVPMDFVVSGKHAPAGNYRVIEQRPGMVFVKTSEGANVAIATLPVQTKGSAKSNTLTFERKNGSYSFTGYCAEGRGCWSIMPAAAGSERIEVALASSR